MIDKPDYGNSTVRYFGGGLIDEMIDAINNLEVRRDVIAANAILFRRCK